MITIRVTSDREAEGKTTAARRIWEALDNLPCTPEAGAPLAKAMLHTGRPPTGRDMLRYTAYGVTHLILDVQ